MDSGPALGAPRNDGVQSQPPDAMHLHAGVGPALDSLKDHAVAIGEFDQLVELILADLGFDIEPQAQGFRLTISVTDICSLSWANQNPRCR